MQIFLKPVLCWYWIFKLIMICLGNLWYILLLNFISGCSHQKSWKSQQKCIRQNTEIRQIKANVTGAVAAGESYQWINLIKWIKIAKKNFLYYYKTFISLFFITILKKFFCTLRRTLATSVTVVMENIFVQHGRNYLNLFNTQRIESI